VICDLAGTLPIAARLLFAMNPAHNPGGYPPYPPTQPPDPYAYAPYASAAQPPGYAVPPTAPQPPAPGYGGYGGMFWIDVCKTSDFRYISGLPQKEVLTCSPLQTLAFVDRPGYAPPAPQYPAAYPGSPMSAPHHASAPALPMTAAAPVPPIGFAAGAPSYAVCCEPRAHLPLYGSPTKTNTPCPPIFVVALFDHYHTDSCTNGAWPCTLCQFLGGFPFSTAAGAFSSFASRPLRD
jgi:hypothetical protein